MGPNLLASLRIVLFYLLEELEGAIGAPRKVLLQALDDMCRKPERQRFQMSNVVDASRRELTRAENI